jgi:hypothetical protein
MPNLLTREDLEPLELTCAKCRGPATGYHDGTYCPRCSPAWVGSFLAHLHKVWLSEATHDQ